MWLGAVRSVEGEGEVGVVLVLNCGAEPCLNWGLCLCVTLI